MAGQVQGCSRFFINVPSNPLDMLMEFKTNGASNPTGFSENIESVTRLSSTGGKEFYRIKLLAPAEERTRIVWADATIFQSIDDLDDFEAVIPLDIIPTLNVPFQVPSATAPKRAREYDVTIRNGATRALTNQVVAGRQVTIRIIFDKAGKLP